MSRGSAVCAWGALGALVVGVAGIATAAGAAPPGGIELTAAHISGEMKRYGIGPLPGRTSLEIAFEFEGRRGHNVIGYLPASDGGGGTPEGPAVLLGTHYAEAGPDQTGGARVPADRDELVDLVTVLLTAKRLATVSLRHPVIVAFWSDSGQPRTGSRAFVEQSDLMDEGLLACIHLDGVGPVPKNRLQVLGAGSSTVWRGLVERANVPVGFDIQIEDELNESADSLSFHQAGVPAISLNAVGRGDPPAPPGEMKTPDLEETERVARFAALLVRRLDGLDEPPEFVDFARQPGKPRLEKQSAYTGTIPDYTAQVEGLLLSGVMEGGPAATAGLAAGDVIVEFDGKQISDIYGYRDALEEVEVGRPLQVVFIRDGERREVTVVPTARP